MILFVEGKKREAKCTRSSSLARPNRCAPLFFFFLCRPPPLLASLISNSVSLSLFPAAHENGGGDKKQPRTACIRHQQTTTKTTKQPFTAPSALFWCLLSAATVVDYFKTRQLSAVTRGASVRRGIRWVVAMYALDSILLLVLSLAENSKFSDVVDFASLLLEDFAEAAFLLLLLAVAAGVGIARPGPGPHRGKVLLVPLVYLVTTLAVDLAEVRDFFFFAARLFFFFSRRRRQKKKKTSQKLFKKKKNEIKNRNTSPLKTAGSRTSRAAPQGSSRAPPPRSLTPAR